MRRYRLESRLHDFLTGECDEAERHAVESLLERDEKARALLEEMREAHDALLLLRDRPAPDAPLDDIRRTIAAGVFQGKPEPVMNAWGTQFYKRVAAAAVLVGGVSLGLLAHDSFRAEEPATTATTESAPSKPSPEPLRGEPGGISAYELMRRNNGNLVTFTPTDSVRPVIEPESR